MVHGYNKMNQLNGLNQSIKYTCSNSVSVLDQIACGHHTQKYFDHLSNIHATRASNVRHHYTDDFHPDA